MSRDALERQILDLWVTSRIPLTRAHIQHATGARRQDLDKWLDELTMEGALELDLGSDNEIHYKVPGAERPPNGPTSFADLNKKAGRKGKLTNSVVQDQLLNEAAKLAKSAGRALKEPTPDGKKSLAMSAGLSLFGPLGWLYAGDFKEAIPATVVYLVLAKFLGVIFLLPAIPLSVIAGLVYAWQYNKEGRRLPIFLADPEEKKS